MDRSLSLQQHLLGGHDQRIAQLLVGHRAFLQRYQQQPDFPPTRPIRQYISHI